MDDATPIKLGIRSMDDEHISLTTALVSISDPSLSRDRQLVIFHEIVDNLIEHTAHEEAMMEKFDFPGTAIHKSIHASLKNFLLAQLQHIDDHPTQCVCEIATSTLQILLHHVIESDSLLATHIREVTEKTQHERPTLKK